MTSKLFTSHQTRATYTHMNGKTFLFPNPLTNNQSDTGPAKSNTKTQPKYTTNLHGDDSVKLTTNVMAKWTTDLMEKIALQITAPAKVVPNSRAVLSSKANKALKNVEMISAWLLAGDEMTRQENSFVHLPLNGCIIQERILLSSKIPETVLYPKGFLFYFCCLLHHELMQGSRVQNYNQGRLVFPLPPANAAFAVGSGCRRFATITQIALNRFKPLRIS
ncbi:hypothetical protein YC2023_095336 [Brassica napus]